MPDNNGEILSPGRDGMFTECMPARVIELCMLGLTDKEVACSIDITLSQLERWKREIPEFREAFKSGRDTADAKVAASMYHRATGYSYEESKTVVIKGIPVELKTTKHWPPDVGAASLILRNHQSGKFKDTKELVGKISFSQVLEELESGGG